MGDLFFFDRHKTEDERPTQVGVPYGNIIESGQHHDDERTESESHTTNEKNAPQKVKK